MTEEELIIKYKDYAWYASQVRGSVLNEIIMMERVMDEYISSYFCENEAKTGELMAVILSTDKITFNSKREVLETIMKRRHPVEYNTHKKTIRCLEDIMKERNKLAHYMLMYSEDAVKGLDNKEFILIRFKDWVTHETFGEKRVTELITMVNNCMALLLSLHPRFSEGKEVFKITSPTEGSTPVPE